ncbi:MAG TPA: hypothetical protein PLQ20_02105, partial [Candidatus Paceibacterota bacterium]|nr:hypothetical protein [Candidatus Paceibacterota bacterium]
MNYPVYVISKGRFDLAAHTSRFLLEDNVSHKIVIEPQEKNQYANRFGEDNLLVLPFSNLNQGGIPARNWCWEHSLSMGSKKHWILDDNISGIVKFKEGKRVKCSAKEAFQSTETFIDSFS